MVLECIKITLKCITSWRIRILACGWLVAVGAWGDPKYSLKNTNSIDKASIISQSTHKDNESHVSKKSVHNQERLEQTKKQQDEDNCSDLSISDIQTFNKIKKNDYAGEVDMGLVGKIAKSRLVN